MRMRFLIIVGTLIGAVLGAYLGYILNGAFPYEVLAGGLVVAILLTVFELIKLGRGRTKTDLPESDKRVIDQLFRYFAYASHVFIAILIIGIIVFTMLGNETISIFYVWVLLFLYVLVAGIGGFFVKGR